MVKVGNGWIADFRLRIGMRFNSRSSIGNRNSTLPRPSR